MLIKKISEFENSVNLRSLKGASLVDGCAGISLLYLEIFQQTKNKNFFSKSLAYLRLALAIEKTSKIQTPFLFGGSLGITWILGKLVATGEAEGLRKHFDARLSGLSTTIDSYLASEGRYELMSGAVGLGVLGESLGESGLTEKALTYLEDTLVSEGRYSGNSFYRSYENTAEIWRNDVALSPRINTGVSHGISGVLLFSSSLKADRAARISEALARTILYIDKVKETASLPSYFPDKLEPKQNSWCYGDMGVGLALLTQGHNANDSEVLAHGKRIFLRGRGVFEAQSKKSLCLCHGVPVVKLMLQRYNQITGEQRGLSMDEELLMNADYALPGFVTGDAGRLLAQISRLDSATGWEKLFLIREA